MTQNDSAARCVFNELKILKRKYFIAINFPSPILPLKMKINQINIPKEIFDNGLFDLKFSRLSNVVILAGKNGAGKSRILNKIQKTLLIKPKLDEVNEAKNKIKTLNAKINSHKIDIAKKENTIATRGDLMSTSEYKSNENHINSLKDAIKSFEKKKEDPQRVLDWPLIVTDKLSNNYKIVHFVPKKIELSDPNDFTKNQMITIESKIKAAGVENLADGSLATIQLIQDRWYNAEHPNSKISQHKKDLIIGKYRKLQKLVSQFLNTEITRDANGDANIFNFPLGNSHLSDGQKILIQFCLAILEQDVELSEIILLLDEPENHLHPSVMIETIDIILKSLKDGQAWIATHSIPLLAHFDPYSIWFVDENKVSNAGKIPEKVLTTLLGNEIELLKLRDFINLPDRLAIQRFATECLTEPKILWTDKNDIQSSEINKILNEISNRNIKSSLKVLDFGAGKGRILSNIKDNWIGTDSAFYNFINYYAYDIPNDDNEYCENIINLIYKDTKKRFFSSENELKNAIGSHFFDIIILCNVLHEIHPIEWLKLFSPSGLIGGNLKHDGYLLIVEDYQMPIGEKAHENGFLVLDTTQLRELFDVNFEDFDKIIINSTLDHRIKAHLIPAKFVIQISNNSRINCLRSLSEFAANQIRSLRENLHPNYKDGTKHSFWVQQFANSLLALKQFS